MVCDVPVRSIKIKIVASHIAGAPIHEFASRAAGTFFDVEQTLELMPKAGQLYSAPGELKKGAPRVRLEDGETKKAAVTTSAVE